MSEVLHKDESLEKLQSFWSKYKNIILGAVAAIVLVVGGYFGYTKFLVQPKEEKATLAIYKAQQYFDAAIMQGDTAMIQRSLNGDVASSTKGFLYVIKNYDGSKSANLAKYYAGICYLKLGDFKNAIKYLKDFSTNAAQVQMMAYGCLGDAYSEQGSKEEAITSYKKAAAAFEKDEMNASEYLFRAALLSEAMGKTKEALEIYKELKTKFPRTDRGAQIDKYIYRLSIEKNDFTVK